SSSLATPTKHREVGYHQSPFIFLTMFYTYIIFSERKQQYYVGLTQDVDDRLKRHNKSHNN
ncbi:MAG: GIY-YIG nuclease family protein, partial [Bacteroidales bacterium]|nr:GIY-YIG nuclease family protein [Bacteroidales bacterium]